MRFLTALGLRCDLHLAKKEAPGKYRLQKQGDHSPVEVTTKQGTCTVSFPSPDSTIVDLHERTCECGLTEEPLTGSDLHPIRGCHHLRFADLRVLAAPETRRQVTHKFGIRLGEVLDLFGASNLMEVRKRLKDLNVLPARTEDHENSEESNYPEARIDVGQISGIGEAGVVPQYSQEQVTKNGERYWIVRTEQDLVGGLSE